ncbi:MAG: hypoxanthine phosphoribosyltransferase [Hyphomicrobiaceae bacterium]|nr:MAG: hypoxanthine phosphoribosyltransferase [Hyphomicrobiaceae bacterium]
MGKNAIKSSANCGHKIEMIFSPEDIAARVSGLAGEIREARLEPLLVVAILKGSFIFAADLIRALHRAGIAPEVEFLSLSSYRAAMKSSGQVSVLNDVETDVRERNVLIIDDILESGRTLAFAKDLLAARGARRVLTCVLLDKGSKRETRIEADFKAFACPDVWVVGYGMDLGHRYRELPFVGSLVSAQKR